MEHDEKSKAYMKARKIVDARYAHYDKEGLLETLAWEGIRYREVVKEADLLRRVAKQLKKVVAALAIP